MPFVMDGRVLQFLYRLCMAIAWFVFAKRISSYLPVIVPSSLKGFLSILQSQFEISDSLHASMTEYLVILLAVV